MNKQSGTIGLMQDADGVSDQLDGAVSFWEPLGQTKVMQICQRETQSHKGK